jgi:predicted nucleic acid-binding protein
MNIADQAVRLRAQYQFKIPDAIQLGTAVACGADYIITNDAAWKQFAEVTVLLVGDL